MFVVVTLCALVSPFLPAAAAWIGDWWRSPKPASRIYLMVTPSGGRLPPGKAPIEEEETLTGS
ncbi:MAG TPA: hypothetical protein VGJ26_08825 [Pirellulales bacterium]|jgi:hypothetical protein